MKKIRDFMRLLDQKVDVAVLPHWNVWKQIVPVLAFIGISLLVTLAFWRLAYQRPEVTSAVIHSDMRAIMEALEKIDHDCDILSFDYERNKVDFLTVKSFVGSEVGNINLAYPRKWRGPYLEHNPVLHGKVYEVVRVKQGYFLMPGDGVKLPNGFVLGVDVIITNDTSIRELIKTGGPLNHRGEQLAQELPFKIGDYKGPGVSSDTVEKVAEALEEFSEAMPYATNRRLEKDDSKANLKFYHVSVPDKV